MCIRDRYALGILGVPRREVELFEPAYLPYTIAAAFGAFLILGGLGSLFVQLWLSIRRRDMTKAFVGDPWNGRTLEWSTSSPPPEYNFAIIPTVSGRDAFFDQKSRGEAYRAPDAYEDIEMPRNSAVGIVIG